MTRCPTALSAALTRLLTLLLCAAGASAGQSQDAWALIDRMPEQAGLVVVADKLDATLATPQGRSLMQAVEASGFFRPTFAQWSELAGKLGMAPREALDRFFGRRTVFVSTRVNPMGAAAREGAGDWALMIWISEDAERVLRKKLDLAPRTKIASHPISAAEHGEFSLALMSEQPRAGEPAQTVLILSPAKRDALLEPLIRSLTSTDAPHHSAARRPATHPNAAINLLIRPEDGTLIALSAHASPGGWDADLVVEEPASTTPKCGRRSVNQAQFEAYAQDSILLLMESAPERLEPNRDESLALTSSLVDIPERFLKLMGGRTLIRARRAGAPEPGLELTLASEATYPGNAVAEGDRAIGALLDPTIASVPPEGAIEGQYPGAVRSTTYDTERPTPFGARARAEWAFSKEGLGEQRWWSLRIAPEASPRAGSLRSFSDDLASAPTSTPSGIVSMGLVRPRELLDVFADVPWAGLGPVRAIAHVERVSWRIHYEAPEPDEDSSACLISGHARVELVPPAEGGGP